MSIYSLTVAFERFLYYRKARNQSVAYAKMVTGFLKQDKLQEAIDASKKFKNSHVARVLSAGLYEFSARHQERRGEPQGPRHDRSRRARHRARGAGHDRRHEEGPLGGLATIGSTAPFIGLFGTVIGIINAFRGMAMTARAASRGLGRHRRGARHDGLRPLRRRSRPSGCSTSSLNKIERFQVEMSNSASRADRLLHQAPRRGRAAVG